MAGDYLEVGDVVKDSSTGPGTITDITDAGYPQVNHIAVAWLERADGAVFDPQGVREKTLAARKQGDTMTEPTDAELWQFYMTLPGATPTSQPNPIEIMRATLAKWGTPPVAKWAPEEIADGERGIRWVTNEGIHGRPTDHDVREYLKRTPTAHGCHCDECKQFYTAPQPTQSQTQEG